MAYSEQTWADGDPTKPVSAARMQHIEDGLAAVANGGSLPALAPSGDVTGATDAATINALIAAGGVTIQLGAGTFWVNASISVPTYVTILGLGPNITTIKRAADVSVISQVGTNAVRSRNGRVLGMTIDGNTGNGFVSSLWVQQFLSDPVMRDVILFGADGIGLDQLEVWDLQSDNLIISTCGGNSSATSTTATGVNASNSTTVNVGSASAFPASGTFVMLGTYVAYTGKTATSFTGCSNHPVTAGGEAVTLAYPAHRIACSTTDTSNNHHYRGYRNEVYRADGAVAVMANGSRAPINIQFTDYKFEQHGAAGIIANFAQVVGLKLRGGNVSHTGALAAGVAQGGDLITIAGGENIEIDATFLNPGTFSASDIRSLINLDGSVNAINGVTLDSIDLHQGSGSQPVADIRFAGTVNNYAERNVTWGNKTTWTEPHWAGAPTTLAPSLQWPSPSLITGGASKWFTVPSGASTAAPANGTAHATPFLVSRNTTFAQIAANTTIAGAAGSLYRLGIYADNGSGYPGALVLDAGTVATDTAAGFKQIAISQALDPGLYWLAAVAQGGVAVPTLTAVANPIPFMIETTFTGVVPVGFTEVAAGALQTPFSVSVSTVSAAVRVWLGT